jgi:NADH-quinone oxidoreductase subunit L
MINLMPWIPLFPLIGALLLASFVQRAPRPLTAGIGVGSVLCSFAAAIATAAGYFAGGQTAARIELWRFLDVGGIAPSFAFRLDALSMWMVSIVTGVGLLIHVYASEYMQKDAAYTRFMALLNLFTAAMLVLVLSDNLLGMFLGWEGVGLCSYLLIGFWWENPVNGRAARKAFFITRIGDVALAIAMFLLLQKTGSLDIVTIIAQAPQMIQPNTTLALIIGLLLLAGAMGKSGQVPLHTWLPDAMAGPTPVSAMIHAATMVTAGVYLIARLHPVIELSSTLMLVITVVGTLTMLVGGLAALAQTDMKRVLAYSTISQIGYMFLALGAGAWSAALFHVATHAFFKALLFLAAGLVIEAAHHEQDITRLGGLRSKLPFAYGIFVIGCGSLAALPVITSSFYSKDLILASVWEGSGPVWAILGLLGGLITATYSFRLLFLTFHGEARSDVHVDDHSGLRMRGVLAVLAVFSLIAGFAEVPLLGVHAVSGFLEPVLGETLHHNPTIEIVLQIASAVCSLAGAGIAFAVWGKGKVNAPNAFLHSGLGFDAAYDLLLARPFLMLVGESRSDWVDLPFRLVTELAAGVGDVLGYLQRGRVGWYAAGLAIGAAFLLAMVEFT